MRILVVPSWYPTPRSPVNGIFVREQARALGQIHDVRVLYLDVLPRGEHRRARRWINRQDGLTEETIEVANRPLLWQFAYLWQMFRALRRISREFRPDVIHCHIAVPATWGVTMLRHVARVPIVLTENSSEFRSWLKRPGLRWMAHRAFARVSLIVAVSEGQKRLIERTFPSRTPIRVVPNMVDTTRFAPSPMQPTEEGYRLLFVGLLETDQKGLHILLDALTLIQKRGELPLHVNIVGDGALRPAYEAQADKLGLHGIVTFLGIKAQEEIIQLLRASHALVLPSLHEALPLVIIEALTSGRPVISTSCGGPEFLVNASNGLIVEPGQAAPLANAITQLLAHLSEYDPYTIAADAVKRYGHDAVTSALTEIFQRLTRNNS